MAKKKVWRYYVVAQAGLFQWIFLGTVWGKTRRIAKTKVQRRYPHLKNYCLVGPKTIDEFLITDALINPGHPKIVRDPAFSLTRSIITGWIEDTYQEVKV